MAVVLTGLASVYFQLEIAEKISCVIVLLWGLFIFGMLPFIRKNTAKGPTRGLALSASGMWAAFCLMVGAEFLGVPEGMFLIISTVCAIFALCAIVMFVSLLVKRTSTNATSN